jgi:hypothetical protein
MKTPLRILLLLILVSFAGCLPQERFWWSPDGSQAVVLVGKELRLVSAGGELKAPVWKEGYLDGDNPLHVSWLPDGSGFVVQRHHELATWGEARSFLPETEVREIERRAAVMPDVLLGAAKLATEEDAIDSLLSTLIVREKELSMAAFQCAWERQREAIETALLSAPKGTEIVEELNKETPPFEVHEICLIKLGAEPKPIVRSVRSMMFPQVSPKFPVVAYWRASHDPNQILLEVSSFDGTSRLEVADSGSATFDWMPDGRSLVFVSSVSNNDSPLQNIQRTTVIQESGELAGPSLERVDLAVAIIPTPPRVCALPDGRVLFASQPAALPASSKALNLDPRLYLISADGESVSMVPTAPGDLPANLSFFVPSPDAKHIAVVESDTDAVAVVELATGKTEIISPAHPNWRCKTMPAWKSATELTFAALSSPAGSPKWMLWTRSGVRSISDKWPAESTQHWLEERKNDPVTPKTTP